MTIWERWNRAKEETPLFIETICATEDSYPDIALIDMLIKSEPPPEPTQHWH